LTHTTTPTIHLLEGPVGAGKSTLAGKLSVELQAPHLNLDEWMVTLFREDRPDSDFLGWYAERKERCIEQIWLVANEILFTNNNVILELGLVQRAAREAFYQRVAGTDHNLLVYWLDVAEATRRQRVKQRNSEQGATFKMEVSDEVFAMANAAWEAPDDEELRDRASKIV